MIPLTNKREVSMSIDKYEYAIPSQYTYKDMSKPEKREWMSKCHVASLGTQSGGFGMFTEQFRVLTLSGSKVIISEIKKECPTFGIENCPTLMELLK